MTAPGRAGGTTRHRDPHADVLAIEGANNDYRPPV